MNPTGKGGFGQRKQQINRKGRPRSFASLRRLAQQIATAESEDEISVIQAMLTDWTKSKEPQLQIKFVEIAYGKVTDTIEVSGKNGDAINVHFVDYRAGLDAASETEK